MAYITKEEVQKCLNDLSSENLIGNDNDTLISLAEAKDRIEELPTADVVPKSEVERLEGELIVETTRRKNAVDAYHEARQKIAREIFEEIEDSCVVKYGNSRLFAPECFAELKKKYTGVDK